MKSNRHAQRMVFLTILFLLTCGSAADQTNRQLWVRIHLQDAGQTLSTEIQQYNQMHFEGMPGHLLDVIISEPELEQLGKLGYDIEIISDNYAQAMSTLDSLFYSNERAAAFTDSLYILYSDIMKIDTLGTTFEGRPIRIVKLSVNVGFDDPGKIGVFYSGCIHANELAGTNVVLALMDTILTGYAAGDPEMLTLLNDVQFWMVPILNPDGVAYVFDNQTLAWRKNRSDSGNGNYGVDLNRNFSYMWDINDTGSSPNPASDNYRGATPFSELESQAVREFFEGPGSEDRNLVYALTYHMKYGSGAFLYPWYWMNAHTPHHPVYYRLAEDFTAITGNYHGTAWETVGYNANGALDEWAYVQTGAKPGILANTVEIGGSGMMPDYPIDLLLSTHIPANLQLMKSTRLIPDYRHIVDRIGKPQLSCSYLHPGQDTLHIEVATNGNTADLDINAQIKDFLELTLDTLSLHDNGLSGDRSAGDGVFSAEWVPKASYEEVYKLTLQGILRDSVNLAFPDTNYLTTIGPITATSTPITKSDSITQAGEYGVKIALLNHGSKATAKNVKVIMRSDHDSLNFTANTVEFGDIAAEESKEPGNSFYYYDYFWFELSSPPTSDVDIPLYLDIHSGDQMYWQDTVYLRTDIVGLADCPAIPHEFKLEINFPNPFNPSTQIRYSIPEMSDVRLTIYDVLGKEIAKLVDDLQSGGSYEVQWSGLNRYGEKVPTGLYYAQLTAGKESDVIKMLLLK